MEFKEQLRLYMQQLDCTAGQLAETSGLSQATLSRYRSGERVPDLGSENLQRLCAGIAELSGQKPGKRLTAEQILQTFMECPQIMATDTERMRSNLNLLLNSLQVNVSRLCRAIHYDPSAVFRIRNGQRQPSNPLKFSADVAAYIAREYAEPASQDTLAALLGCEMEKLQEETARCERIKSWLLEGQQEEKSQIADFLEKLDSFDLNEYIKAIHFDTLKVPDVPFQLPTARSYQGLQEMMNSELDFLKATVLAKNMNPVVMYSDMPMEAMAKDEAFAKKWMFGMAMMLKKGLKLRIIHNVDRPFHEMMLGLESFIPMYMTGQIEPYYLKKNQGNVFLHLLRVSGGAALSGEAIAGAHEEGRYYLTKKKEEIGYYRKRAEALLKNAHPLMQMYRRENQVEWTAFLQGEAKGMEKRRYMLWVPPVYTLREDTLQVLLQRQKISEKDSQRMCTYARQERERIEEILQEAVIEVDFPEIPREEFVRYPVALSLAGMFFEQDILYTYEEYRRHLEETKAFAAAHERYVVKKTTQATFRNLQIGIHEGRCVVVTKEKSPAIHFVIYHPKMREAIEHFIPPMVEK